YCLNLVLIIKVIISGITRDVLGLGELGLEEEFRHFLLNSIALVFPPIFILNLLGLLVIFFLWLKYVRFIFLNGWQQYSDLNILILVFFFFLIHDLNRLLFFPFLFEITYSYLKLLSDRIRLECIISFLRLTYLIDLRISTFSRPYMYVRIFLSNFFGFSYPRFLISNCSVLFNFCTLLQSHSVCIN
ncbi:hypothetical protein L9F63_023811, partial [Diploptera punctata]